MHVIFHVILIKLDNMLKQGITPKMVENYYSKDAATHMREFCKSHGLL